ncbi:MAG TPA: N-acetylglucosamine-6-phosphate deacetylase [Marmoricola sp.]|nr:N-acetylglucosamine-6-phosphate deacetylase [Marmoricola sp.]
MVGRRLVGLGAGSPRRPADVSLGDATVVPGFVDMHVHGGGGGSFSEASAEGTRRAVELHARHGTTTMVASLVSAPPEELLRQVGVLAEQVEEGLVAGIHLEGPWLAPGRRGAHDASALRDPHPAEIDRVLRAGRGTIRMVTLAPELDGAHEAIKRVVGAGSVAAVGHTDATYQQTRAAIAAGATVGTHLFNAMRPVHHREPGPVVALLEDPRVTVELIADGVHLDAALARHVWDSAGIDRVTLVTDAMAAAGMPDGEYRLGALPVRVADGVATVAGTTTIAGSTATMDELFRYAVLHCNRDQDTALVAAARLTSINPARALGLPEPAMTEGASADLVVLDAALTVTAVMRRGTWATP